jgi:predicted DCC family thiol-disulfide oxidoreductase YuxK
VSATPGTLVFDGDCAFCSTSARLLRRWVPSRAELVPWQFADLPLLGLTRTECTEAVQWVGAGDDRAAGAAAVARFLQEARPHRSGRYWRLAGRLLGTRPAIAVARPVYAWVARNRHRLPGGSPACATPAPTTLRSQRVADE